MSDSWQVLAKGLQNKNGNLPQIAIAVVTPEWAVFLYLLNSLGQGRLGYIGYWVALQG